MESISNFIIIVISTLIITAGIAGLLLPFLPGTPLIFLGVLFYAIFTSFTTISLQTILILAIFAILSLAKDFLFSFLGAKKAGITNYGIGGGILGLLVGLLFSPIGIFSIIVFPIIGIIIGEIVAGKRITESARIGLGALIGLTIGISLELVIAGIMIFIFLRAIF